MRGSKIDRFTTDASLLRLQSLAMRGLSDEQVAESIGVPYRTFKRWKSKDPRIAKALGNGKEVAVAAIENALFKKAQAGDLGAMCFFLKNRDPEHWSEHPELRGSSGKVVFIDDIPRAADTSRPKSGSKAEQPDHS